MDLGVHRKQHHFRLDGSEMGKIFQGNSPANDGLKSKRLKNRRTARQPQTSRNVLRSSLRGLLLSCWRWLLP